MELKKRKYPIGIQTFSEIIEGGWVYVDKTGYVYRLANTYKNVFLSRPRRFGKSLLTTTICSYFNGDKHLFEGLEAGNLEKRWEQYPILRFDLSLAKNTDVNMIANELQRQLSNYKDLYGRIEGEELPGKWFAGMIKRAYEYTGKKVVVVIDEYDAPMLDVLHVPDKLDVVRSVMQEFYAPLKACDEYLRFVFITGITKFSQLSIFSTLNNLVNISMEPEYSGICGISQQELETSLRQDVEEFAQSLNISYTQALEKLKEHYDGYHFSKTAEDIYNPFSLISALQAKDFNSYWFGTGTPTFLIEQLKRYNVDFTKLDSVEAFAHSFDSPSENMKSALPLLYQSGYITIKGYDPQWERYMLGIPNKEVKIGLLDTLMTDYVSADDVNNYNFIVSFCKAIDENRMDDALAEMRVFLASIPSCLSNKTERDFQTMFYLIFSMLGKFIETEVCNAQGRADIVLKTRSTIYVMELKLDGSVDEALQQIDKKGYMIPYTLDHRKLVKVGINFDTNQRTISDWRIV